MDEITTHTRIEIFIIKQLSNNEIHDHLNQLGITGFEGETLCGGFDKNGLLQFKVMELNHLRDATK